MVLNNIGGLYLETNASVSAEKYFSQSLTILEKELGVDHLITKKIKTNLISLKKQY
jgi:hypothetical protein